MKIEAPCRLGERFDCCKPYSNGRFTLTGLTFFYWESSLFPGTTLCGKRDAQNRLENSTFFEPGDAESGVRISFEVPDAIVIPGYQLSELGLDTKAVGHLAGLSLTEEGWAFYISYGKDYGGPLKPERTEELDRLFEPVLPLHAVQVNWKEFLL